MENDRGAIKEGYLADFALLSDDYLKVDDAQILKLESLLTILNGEVVYGAGEYIGLDKNRIDIIPNWSPVKYYGGYQNIK
jgi:hypothetical protein